MSGFLLLFLSIYSSMHLVVFLKSRVLLPDKGFLQFFAAVFFVLMIFAPIGVRLLERNGHHAAAHAAAHIGYVWMGFLFVCFCAFLMLGGIELLYKGACLLAKAVDPPFPARVSALGVLSLAFVICLYGCFEAQWIRTERVRIGTEKLPAGVDRLRIVQISDVHLGLIVQKNRLQKILRNVQSEDPDILVCTGDLIDGHIAEDGEIARLFDTVRPPYGKFAVTGNHEAYAGMKKSIKTMERFGFMVLQNQVATVGNLVNIAGVDDPAIRPAADEAEMLSSVDRSFFTILLKHRPEVLNGSQGLFDLQLSGHTHRGQIFPFRLVTRLAYPMQDGFYELEKGSSLYTSRGSGTWGPPIRVLSPPEVTVIELHRQEAS